MEVMIRNAKQSEGELLANIEQSCFPPAEAASKEEVLKRIQVFPENFFVAEADGKVVGFINGGNTMEQVLPDVFYHDLSTHRKDGLYQSVFGLNVLSEYRRQGIGEKLVRHYVEAARERGKKGVILTCKKEKIHFYEKIGFTCHGAADSSHGDAIWYDMRQIF